MDTRGVTAAAAMVSPVAAPVKQASAPSPAQPAPERTTGEAAQNGYKVTISTQPGGVVESHGALDETNKEVNASMARVREKNADETKAVQMEAQYAQFNTNLRRDYAVEANSRVVMRVLQKADDKVIKEIPSSADRHVRDAMLKYAETSGDQASDTSTDVVG